MTPPFNAEIELMTNRLNDLSIESEGALHYWESIRQTFHAEKITYRLNEVRYKNLLEGVWKNSQPGFFERTEDSYDVLLNSTVRPIFINDQILEEVEKMGSVIYEAIKASVQLSESVFENFGDFFSSPKSERQGNSLTAPHNPLGLYRIDYFLVRQNQKIVPKLFDINLLPGMTFINSKIYNCTERLSTEYFTKQSIQFLPYNPYIVLNQMRSEFENWRISKNIQQPDFSVAILIRKGHGLHSDMLHLKRLFEEKGIVSELIYPQEILDLSEHNILTTKGTFTAAFRMIRPVTKHIRDMNEFETENKVIEGVLHQFRNGNIFVFPGFHAYLENNFWFWAWKNNSYKDHYLSVLGTDSYDYLKMICPDSGLIQDNIIQWADGSVSQLEQTILKNVVIKKGDTTGAKEVYVLKNPSNKQRAKLMDDIKGQSGYVAQEFLPCIVQRIPVKAYSGSMELKKANIQFMSYFSGTKHVGTIALASTSSKKIHGGADSYILPLAIYK